MIFINTLLNYVDDLEERSNLRREFLDLGLKELISQSREWARPFTNQLYRDLETQLDIFDNSMFEDQKEATFNGVDLSDPDSVYSYIRKDCTENNRIDQLVAILQQLMMIPDDGFGSELWSTIAEIVKFVLTPRGELRPDQNPYPKINELKVRFASSGSVDSHYTKIIDELKQQVEKTEIELHRARVKDLSVTEEVEKEKRRYEALQRDFEEFKKSAAEGKGVGDSSKATIDSQNLKITELLATIEKLKQAPPSGGEDSGVIKKELDDTKKNLQQKLDRIDQLEKALTAGGLQIPEEKKIEEVSAAASPPPAMGAPPPPPPAANGPPPGKKPKAAVKYSNDQLKMKPVFWSKLQNNVIQNTVWNEIDEEKTSALLDLGYLEKAFCQPPKKKKDEEKKQEKVKLVDDKRSYNIDLILSRFKVPADLIRDAILVMDEGLITPERIPSILKCVPTDKEIEKVKSFTGDVSTVGNAEKLFLALQHIPNLQIRMEMWAFKVSLEGIVQDLQKKLTVIITMTAKIRTSKGFKQLLEVILALGNFLNGSGKTGGAYGFKIGAIKTLGGTKTLDGKSSLLEYVILLCRDKFPIVETFLSDFDGLGEAVRIESKEFTKEVQALKENMVTLKESLEWKTEDPMDRYNSVMTPFYEKANQTVSQFLADVSCAQADVEKLAASFGEETKEFKWEEFFKQFVEIVEAWNGGVKAIKALDEEKAKEERLRRAEERKAKLLAEKKAAAAAVASTGADKVWEKLQHADAKETLEEINQRRHGGQLSLAKQRSMQKQLEKQRSQELNMPANIVLEHKSSSSTNISGQFTETL
jgi:hypothetical protein